MIDTVRALLLPWGVLRKAGLLLSFAALVTLSGAHWAVLQSCAWAKMTLQNARSLPWGEALAKTFGGGPCDDCRSIQQAKKQEEESSPLAQSESKSEKWMGPDIPVIVLTTDPVAFENRNDPFARGWVEPPSTPPPRPFPLS